MTSDSGATVSTWMSVQMPATNPLERDTTAEICVVGGGLAGVAIAHALAREGRSVALVEDGELGSGETGRTTAHLASALDDGFADLIHLFGEKGAQLAYESHARAIDLIEENVAREQIDCDFTRLDGYLFEPSGGDPRNLREELEAARRAQVAGVHMVGSAPLPFDTGPALRFPGQGQFHPLKYLAALAKVIVSVGGQIYTHTRAREIHGGKDAYVATEKGPRIRASHIVVATNTPVNDMLVMHTKQAPYRTYAIAFHIPQDSVPPGLYWDNADPYHFIRLQQSDSPGGGQLLIVGGEDHKTGQLPGPEAAMYALETWVRRQFPTAGEIVNRWSGQVMEPVDSLAFIGRNPRDEGNVYIVTGDSGHGMTHSTIASMLIPDLIFDRGSPWEKLYDPSRKHLRAAGEYAHENLNVAGQYRDYVTGGEVSSVDQIAPGEGAIMREGARKLAVFRDAGGELHKFSAACPHMQCIVRWNPLERTFDCPCHGSRFAADGHVVNGPAIGGLTAES